MLPFLVKGHYKQSLACFLVALFAVMELIINRLLSMKMQIK